MVFHKRWFMVLGQNHKRRLWKTINGPLQDHKQNHERLWFSGGGMGDMMEAMPRKLHVEPMKAIW